MTVALGVPSVIDSGLAYGRCTRAPLWPIFPSTDTRVASVVLRVKVLRSTHNFELELHARASAAFPSKDIECWAYCDNCGHELAAKAAFGTCFPAWGRAVPGHCILSSDATQCGPPPSREAHHRHDFPVPPALLVGTASSLCSAVIGSTCGEFGALSSRPVSLLRSVLNQGLGDQGENLTTVTPIPDPDS